MRKRQRFTHYLKYIIFDSIIIALAYFLSVLTIFNLNPITNLPFNFDNLLISFPLIIILHVIFFLIFGVYRILVDYFGFEDFIKMIAIIVGINVILFVASIIAGRLDFNFMSPSLYTAITFYEIVLLLLPRVRKRLIRNIIRLTKKERTKSEKVLIIGAGYVGEKIVKEIFKEPLNNKQVIGFLDDSVEKNRQRLMGIKILGPIDMLEQVILENEVNEIIIAIRDFPLKRVREIFDLAAKYNIKTKRFSGIEEVDGEHLVTTEINIDDLLNRGVVNLNNEDIKDFISDEVVLVTGGGGSIGSELCRQIAELNPKCLIIFDIYENNAYDIQQELLRKFKKEGRDLNLVVLIGSVYNYKRLEEVFIDYKPTLVFHAAAYKHVPLMEDSPKEAIRTNVIGTYNTAKLANEYKAKKFILVSSDKAVRSTNVMWATKRFAEMVIQEQQGHSEVTKFSAVRFGNVLGSSGSVIPLFTKQIADGGPITVTHPEITRFFMTIPEAVSLILQAAVYADGGEIFVLDMGEPVKILDLAEKMISLSGFKPYDDINIVFTGLRPGEKLYEELLVDLNSENHIKTSNDLIFVEVQPDVKMENLEMDKIKEVFEFFSPEETKEFIATVVKSYTPSNNH